LIPTIQPFFIYNKGGFHMLLNILKFDAEGHPLMAIFVCIHIEQMGVAASIGKDWQDSSKH
jgi:hypothetical protein